jgi:hypothetical protein
MLDAVARNTTISLQYKENFQMGTLLNEHSIQMHGGGVCCEDFRLLVLDLLVTVTQKTVCCL